MPDNVFSASIRCFPIYRTPFFQLLLLLQYPVLENASSPILVTLSGMAMEIRPVQSRNALSPILVTLSGTVIEVRFTQR